MNVAASAPPSPRSSPDHPDRPDRAPGAPSRSASGDPVTAPRDAPRAAPGAAPEPARGGAPLRASLLGAPDLTWNGEEIDCPSRKPRALLLHLCVRGGPVARDELAELLWGAGKLGSVRQALYELRKLPGADAWLDDGDPVRVRAATDLERIEAGDPEALDAAAGALLADLDVPGAPAFADWLELERARVAELLRERRLERVDDLRAAGADDAALALARRVVDEDPLNETAHRAVMGLEWERGEREAALEQFERLRLLLRDELGVEPLPETLALLSRIQDAAPAATGRAVRLEAGGTAPRAPEVLLGRDAALARVVARLRGGGRVLLHGFGGIGKSALASEAARAFLQEAAAGDGAAAATGVWLELGADGPGEALDALARPFDAAAEIARAERAEEALRGALARAGVRLLVLDDARDAYSLARAADAAPEGCAVLATSRARYPRWERLDVGRLARADAVALLAHHAAGTAEGGPSGAEAAASGPSASGAPAPEPADLDALAAALGDHPFALRLAGLGLRSEGLTPAALLERVRRDPGLLRLPVELAEPGREGIPALLNVSLEPLAEQPHECFFGFGALPAPTATPELLARLLRRDPGEVEDALFDLARRGLAEREAPPGSDLVLYRVHDLAHAYARANSPWRPSSAARAALAYLAAHRDEVEAVELELPNVLGGADVATPRERIEALADLCVRGGHYDARGHSARSLALLRRAAEEAEGADEEAVRALAHRLYAKAGDVLQNHLGRFDEALEDYRRALAIARALGDASRAAVYVSMIGMARYKRGDPDAARDLEEACRLAEAAEPADRCIATLQLAVHRGLEGRLEEARELFVGALATVEGLHDGAGVRPDEVARREFFALVNLAEVEFQLGRADEALALRERALTLADAWRNDLWRAHVLLDLGELHHHRGDAARALGSFREALELYERNHATLYVDRTRAAMRERGLEPSP